MTIIPVSERPDMDMDMAIAKLAEAENRYRDNQKTQMYLKTSKLRYNSNIEDIVCSEARNLSRAQLSELAGCGKSYLACAIGRQACYLGLLMHTQGLLFFKYWKKDTNVNR